MTLLLILFIYFLGAVATLLLICKNVPLEKFIEQGGKEDLYKVGCVEAVLIWPITIIIGLMTLIFRKINKILKFNIMFNNKIKSNG